MSTISAGVTNNTALVNTGDTSGDLQLQVNGTTPSVTLKANGSIGFGSSPAYGTTGQVLTSNGSSAAPTWQNAASGAQGFVTMATGVNAAPGASIPNDSIALI